MFRLGSSSVVLSGLATAVALCIAMPQPAHAAGQAAYVCDPFPIPGTGQDTPVVTTKSGTVWYADPNGNRLVRVNADHSTKAVVPVSSTTAGLSGIALASDGAIWFSKNETHRLGHVPPGGGKGVEFELPAPNKFTKAIAVGADGRVWFADPVNNSVGYMSADGNVQSFDAPVVDGSPASPGDIALATDGSAWVSSSAHNAIYRVDPATGTFARHDIDTPQAQPSVIVRGSHGALWFLMPAIQSIGRITSDGTITTYKTPMFLLRSLGEGPDGAMWVSSQDGLGRLDASTGRVVKYACAGSSGMTVGPDHHLWVLGDSYMYVVRARSEGARARRTSATGRPAGGNARGR